MYGKDFKKRKKKVLFFSNFFFQIFFLASLRVRTLWTCVVNCAEPYTFLNIHYHAVTVVPKSLKKLIWTPRLIHSKIFARLCYFVQNRCFWYMRFFAINCSSLGIGRVIYFILRYKSFRVWYVRLWKFQCDCPMQSEVRSKSFWSFFFFPPRYRSPNPLSLPHTHAHTLTFLG